MSTAPPGDPKFGMGENFKRGEQIFERGDAWIFLDSEERVMQKESQGFKIWLYLAENTDKGQKYSTEIQSEIQREKSLRLWALVEKKYGIQYNRPAGGETIKVISYKIYQILLLEDQ